MSFLRSYSVGKTSCNTLLSEVELTSDSPSQVCFTKTSVVTPPYNIDLDVIGTDCDLLLEDAIKYITCKQMLNV